VLNCEQESIKLATTMVTGAELRELSIQTTTASSGPAMPSSSSAFKAVKDAKAVQIESKDPANTVQIGADLNPK
jgi:hypothetical protein